MTDSTPNPKTLDLAALLAGNEHPTETVEVYMSEAIGYAVYKARKEVERATILQDKDALEAAENELSELIEAGKKVRLTVHIQGINKGLRKSIIRKSLDKFPAEYDFLGRLTPNQDRDTYHANLMWAAMVTKLVGPDGSEGGAPTPEEAETFRDQAPDAATDAIERAIETLTEGAKSGFETLAQEHGFLSRP